MSVEIDPVELGFHRPLTMEVTQILKIKNPNHTPVAFKVKTTAPKQYCVRPNSGRIEPGKEVEVSVLLQAMKEDPPADSKCRDKFLVQSVALTADKEFANVTAIWQHVDNAEKGTVQEKKIRVAFLPPKGSGSSDAAISTPVRNGVSNRSTDSIPPPNYDSPSSPAAAYTPQQQATGPVSTYDDKPVNAKGLDAIKSEVSQPAASTSNIPEVVSNAATAVTSALPSTEELQAQLAQAQQTIASYAQEGGLRLRKAVGADSASTGTTELSVGQQNSAGVPVQIVAALCLLSFLLAYFLF